MLASPPSRPCTSHHPPVLGPPAAPHRSPPNTVRARRRLALIPHARARHRAGGQGRRRPARDLPRLCRRARRTLRRPVPSPAPHPLKLSRPAGAADAPSGAPLPADIRHSAWLLDVAYAAILSALASGTARHILVARLHGASAGNLTALMATRGT
ncbi:hypothetical protein C8R44DRAFT_872262 [Mycena epipterygia]|nr:hypothetical protein C8R44DRAFT_872262 [Mycena epipterygia]